MTVNALSTLLQSLDRAVSKAQTAVVQLQQSAQQAQAAQHAIQNAQNSGSGSGNGSGRNVPNTGANGKVYVYDQEDIANGNASKGGVGALASFDSWDAANRWKRKHQSDGYPLVVGYRTGGYTGR